MGRGGDISRAAHPWTWRSHANGSAGAAGGTYTPLYKASRMKRTGAGAGVQAEGETRDTAGARWPTEIVAAFDAVRRMDDSDDGGPVGGG